MLAHQMEGHILYRRRCTSYNFKYIALRDSTAIQHNGHYGAHCFHPVAVNQECCIFFQSHTQHSRITDDHLKKPCNTSSFNKMCVKNNIIDKAKNSRCDHLPFIRGLRTSPLDNHNFRCCRSAGRGPGINIIRIF